MSFKRKKREIPDSESTPAPTLPSTLATFVDEPKPEIAAPEEAAPVEMSKAEAPAAPVEAPKVEEPAAPVVTSSGRFLVKANKRLSYRGQMVMLRKGDVLNQSGYGADGIRRLREGGADLEEIT
jgi:hypothetical protein